MPEHTPPAEVCEIERSIGKSSNPRSEQFKQALSPSKLYLYVVTPRPVFYLQDIMTILTEPLKVVKRRLET